MNGKTGNLLDTLANSRVPKKRLALFFLTALAITATAEFLVLGLARRTFVFYAIGNGIVTVEDRMLRVSGGNLLRPASREIDITRYVEEALLGPVSQDSLPLFPRETRLRSLLYRNGLVYADFSEEAAMPLPEGGEVLQSMKTLHAGIRRNFPFVRDVRFFIAGRAAFTAEFRQIGDFASPEGY